MLRIHAPFFVQLNKPLPKAPIQPLAALTGTEVAHLCGGTFNLGRDALLRKVGGNEFVNQLSPIGGLVYVVCLHGC